METTVLVPLDAGLAKTLFDAAEALHKAKREFSFKNGVFLDEVAASYQGARRFKGRPHIIYIISRAERS
jgi:hypothetical protein